MKPTGALLTMLACLLFGIGCQAETRTYQVTVKNDTGGPVTIWLFKDGGPYETGWKSPEDLAIESPKADEPIGGRTIRPGAIASAGPISGHFDSDSNAVLRVYRGSHTFNELLAISQDSADRVNAKLRRGDNQFVISLHDEKITLDRTPVGFSTTVP